jgi:hypothetical protein
LPTPPKTTSDPVPVPGKKVGLKVLSAFSTTPFLTRGAGKLLQVVDGQAAERVRDDRELLHRLEQGGEPAPSIFHVSALGPLTPFG